MKIQKINNSIKFGAALREVDKYEDGRLKRETTFRPDRTCRTDVFVSYNAYPEDRKPVKRVIQKSFYPDGKSMYSEEIFENGTRVWAVFFAKNGNKESQIEYNPTTQIAKTRLYYTDTGNIREFIESAVYTQPNKKTTEVRLLSIKYYNENDKKMFQYKYIPETDTVEETSYWKKTGNPKRFFKRRKSLIAEVKKEHRTHAQSGFDMFTGLFKSFKLLAAVQKELTGVEDPVDCEAFGKIYNDIFYDENGNFKEDASKRPGYSFDTGEDEDWQNFEQETKRVNLSADEIKRMDENTFVEHMCHKLSAKNNSRYMIEEEIERLANILDISEEELQTMNKNTFRKLALKYHADVNGNNKMATKLFNIVNELYHASDKELPTGAQATKKLLLTGGSFAKKVIKRF